MNGIATARQKSGPATRRHTFLAHYPQLLTLAYEWQYVDRDILQTVAPDLVSSVRTLQDQLQALRRLDYLKAAPRGTTYEPLLYSTTAKTVELLREYHGQPDLPLTPDGTISPFLQQHARDVSWFQTHVHLAAQQRNDLTILWYERRYHHPARKLTYRARGGEEECLVPDLGFLAARRRPSGELKLALYLVEVDRGTEKPSTLYRKIDRSNQWYEDTGRAWLRQLYTVGGADRPKATYHRLIVTQHRRTAADFDRLVTLYTQALKFPDETRRNLYFATARDIAVSRGSDRPVWYPIHTFNPAWFTPLQGDLRVGREAAVYPAVATRLRQLPRYCLFPPLG